MVQIASAKHYDHYDSSQLWSQSNRFVSLLLDREEDEAKKGIRVSGRDYMGRGVHPPLALSIYIGDMENRFSFSLHNLIYIFVYSRFP